MAASTEISVTAPFAGVIVAINGGIAQPVAAGAPLVVLEAMKMEHEVLAETAGVIGELAVAVGDAVEEGQLLLKMTPGEGRAAAAPAENGAAPAGERSDLRAVRERHEIGLDAAGRTRWRAAMSTAGARRGRTSPTCWTRAASSSTGRCCSQRRSSGAAARS